MIFRYRFLQVFLLLSTGLLGIDIQANAQLELTLNSEKYDFENADYYYAGVKDNRSSVYYLGFLFDRTGKKVDLLLSGGTERALLSQTSQNFRNRNGVSLLIEIDDLAYSETKSRNGLIDGAVNLKLSVFSIHGGDTSLICQPRSSSKYQRSFTHLREESYEPLLSQLWISCLKFTDNYVRQNKSKIEAFNSGVSIIVLPYESRNRGDTVHYKSRSVTWNDFKAEPRHGSKYAAAIFPTIALGTQLTVRDGKLTAILKPQVFMVPSQSWAKSQSKTASSLRHEQIHFDIAKVVMDKLIKKLIAIEATTMDDLSSMIQYEYLESFKEMNRLQDSYDEESNHNLNAGKQNEWARRVEGWLLAN